MCEITNASLLDLDLSSVDTSLPLIADREVVDFIVDGVEKKLTSKGDEMVALKLKSITPTRSVKGEDLQPGVLVFHNINLVPTGKATMDMVVRNLAEVIQAAGLSGVTYQDFKSSRYTELQGKTLRARVAYIPEGPDKTGVVRRAKNEVGLFVRQ